MQDITTTAHNLLQAKNGLALTVGRTFWRRCSALQNLFLQTGSFLLWRLWLTVNTIVFAPLYRETLRKLSEHIWQRQKPTCVTSDGLKSPLMLIEGVKVNSRIYQHIMDRDLLPWSSVTIESHYVFLQDAPTANLRQNCCKRYFHVSFDVQVNLTSVKSLL